MAIQPSDKTVLLREALRTVLDKATAPMNAAEVNSYSEISRLGTFPHETAIELAHLWARKKSLFPIARIAGPKGYEYFNPEVVKLSYPPLPKPGERVNSVKPPIPPVRPEFEFNPVEFEAQASPAHDPVDQVAETIDEPAEPANVVVPAGVKCITISVGGVTIRVEMSS